LFVTQAGLYWVEVKVNNCAARDSIQIELYDQSCDCRITVPNAFSPNGDGKNDLFKIPFITNLKENNVVVFNRWGKKVFEADNYANTWDGENLPSGTYFYVVSAPNFKAMQGTVSIFRE
jgi:gliding motility-associated-like protein